jgi:Type IV secretion system pilin
MNKKITLKLMAAIVIFTALFSFAPAVTPAFAQSTPCTGSNCAQDGLTAISDAFPNKPPANYSVADTAKKIINWALYIAAIIAVIFIIIGGFMYITSLGDPAKATKGRNTLVNALIGLAMIILSYLIVQIVYNFLIQK